MYLVSILLFHKEIYFHNSLHIRPFFFLYDVFGFAFSLGYFNCSTLVWCIFARVFNFKFFLGSFHWAYYFKISKCACVCVFMCNIVKINIMTEDINSFVFIVLANIRGLISSFLICIFCLLNCLLFVVVICSFSFPYSSCLIPFSLPTSPLILNICF